MNRLSEGYKLAVDQNWGRMAKTDFRAENRVFGPEISVHFHDREKLCKQRSTFLQINISPLANFGCFFEEKKTDFWPKKRFSAKHKNGRFSVIPPRTWSRSELWRSGRFYVLPKSGKWAENPFFFSQKTTTTEMR